MHSELSGRRSSWVRAVLVCLGVAAVGTVLVLALAADHHTGVYGTALAPQARLSAAAPLLGVPAWMLRRTRGGPWLSAVAGGIAGAVSLGCSAWMHVVAGRQGSPAHRADAYTLFEISALIVVLVLAVRYGAAWPAAVAAVVLGTAVIVRPVAVEVSENSLLVALFCTFAVCAALVAALVARLIAVERRRHTEQVRLEQRLAFARDLHDFVAHHVTGIVVQAQGAQAVAASRPETIASSLGQIERTAVEALRALRHMVSGLRTEAGFLPAGDVQQLRALVADFALPGGGRAGLVQEGPVGSLPAAAMSVIHRVVMESLTNVRKHAPDSRNVSVTLRVVSGTAELDIVNDRPGPGGDTAGYGLVGLEERVTAEGGTFRTGPDDQGRWRVSARIPFGGVWRDLP
ncbi:sensor histidine kinase [Streptomyces sp. NPDC091281]|uniref:sensor histidine kinase n=1 Tax=Streptomyces sp. NPDC091281 TaxID=3365985 RepID=UPI00382ED7F8